MPPIRSARNRKPPPDGFDDIEDTLLEFGNKMKDAENASHEGKKRHEVLWPIFQISHQRMSLALVGDIAIHHFHGLQVPDIFMTFTTTREPYQSSSTIGYLRMVMRTQIWLLSGKNKATRRSVHWVASLYRTDGERTIVVLPTMYTNKGDKFQHYLYLSSATDTAERRPNHRVCKLWVSWLFIQWLRNGICTSPRRGVAFAWHSAG